jgi:hypothetical protein
MTRHAMTFKYVLMIKTWDVTLVKGLNPTPNIQWKID